MAVTYWEVEDRGYETPCWIWSRAKFKTGYGAVHRGKQTLRAHRLVYAERRGPIPDNLHLDHLCRNKACVNPDHLEPVTKEENERRHWAQAERVTTCIHGHDKNGLAVCKTCNDISKRSYKARIRAERLQERLDNPLPPRQEPVYKSSAEKRARQSASHLLIPAVECPDCGQPYKRGGALARHRQVRHPLAIPPTD